MNKFFSNVHTVPLVNLLTLNTTIILSLALAASYFGYDTKTVLILLLILLIVDVIGHPLMGIPNNTSYFFTLGDKPSGWKY